MQWLLRRVLWEQRPLAAALVVVARALPQQVYLWGLLGLLQLLEHYQNPQMKLLLRRAPWEQRPLAIALAANGWTMIRGHYRARTAVQLGLQNAIWAARQVLAPLAAVQLWAALWVLEVAQAPRHQPKPGQRPELWLSRERWGLRIYYNNPNFLEEEIHYPKC
jgi:hypothetical protein